MPTEEAAVHEGQILYAPSEREKAASRLTAYVDWLKRERGLVFDDYQELHRWSTQEVAAFWQSIVDYFGVAFSDPPQAVLSSEDMPGAHWFPGATLNYAAHALRRRDDHVAVLAHDEEGERSALSYGELASEVARARAGLKALGVEKGDRIAALAPNTAQTLILFLATASLGAIWSSCSPEFGVGSVLDRFSQIEPKLLVTVSAYHYAGKRYDLVASITELAERLPSLAGLVMLSERHEHQPVPDTLGGRPVTSIAQLTQHEAPLEFEAVPFEHPLWILYSSGTTGLPKPILHGHGGIVLEHLKALALHCDLGPDDRFFWFSTTGWMMYNFVVGGLLIGCTVVLYDGSPNAPDLYALWRMAAQAKLTYFGTSAPYLMACRKAGISPKDELDLSRLRALGSTGAPLPVEGFAWVYQAVSSEIHLGSVSGGTDVCTAFVLSCPWLPVRAGEIQVAGLGCKVEAYSPEAKALQDEVGELVLERPMPSMPVGFWGDPQAERYRASYFDVFEGIWRHGDWVKRTASGGYVIYGRSDSTLNRGGVRMGTSEFYRVAEELDVIVDSLVVDTSKLGSAGALWLFVVLPPGRTLDDATVGTLKRHLRSQISPRHVPDQIRQVRAIPRTLNGKKLEVPIKRILEGTPVDVALNRDTLSDPSCLDDFVRLAAEVSA